MSLDGRADPAVTYQTRTREDPRQREFSRKKPKARAQAPTHGECAPVTGGQATDHLGGSPLVDVLILLGLRIYALVR
jgi:hypothetical protein